jgi:hypothetical protein
MLLNHFLWHSEARGHVFKEATKSFSHHLPHKAGRLVGNGSQWHVAKILLKYAETCYAIAIVTCHKMINTVKFTTSAWFFASDSPRE